MRTAWLLPLLPSFFVGMMFAQARPPALPASAAQILERDLVLGGRVNLKLSAGDYVIRPSTAAGKVTVRWRTDKPDQARKVAVTVDVKGSECSIVARGPRNSFHVEIELPSRADLYARLNAGDLNLRGIEGNKNIECHVGDVTIDIGRADDYGPVDASVRIGDVEAPPFGISKGGIARKFKRQGPGKYTLHAHVGVGSLSFLGSPSDIRP